MDRIKNIPNFITMLRILGTICLLFIEPFTVMFFIVYSIAGLTDVLDGLVARITKTSTEFGAKLDSAADLIFYAVMVLRIFPMLLKKVPGILWIVAGIIVAVRVASYTTAIIKYRCFASLHTYLNKLTGFAVFCTPYFYLTPYMTAFCIVLCVIAFASSAEEFCAHLTRDTYRSNLRTVFEKE